MKSKEEIIKKHYEGFRMELGHVPEAPVEDAFKAMDEYSRQQAIVFAEWLKEEIMDNEPVSGKWVTYDYGDKTSGELYELFLENQNKQS